MNYLLSHCYGRPRGRGSKSRHSSYYEKYKNLYLEGFVLYCGAFSYLQGRFLHAGGLFSPYGGIFGVPPYKKILHAPIHIAQWYVHSMCMLVTIKVVFPYRRTSLISLHHQQQSLKSSHIYIWHGINVVRFNELYNNLVLFLLSYWHIDVDLKMLVLCTLLYINRLTTTKVDSTYLGWLISNA